MSQGACSSAEPCMSSQGRRCPRAGRGASQGRLRGPAGGEDVCLCGGAAARASWSSSPKASSACGPGRPCHRRPGGTGGTWAARPHGHRGHSRVAYGGPLLLPHFPSAPRPSRPSQPQPLTRSLYHRATPLQATGVPKGPLRTTLSPNLLRKLQLFQCTSAPAPPPSARKGTPQPSAPAPSPVLEPHPLININPFPSPTPAGSTTFKAERSPAIPARPRAPQRGRPPQPTSPPRLAHHLAELSAYWAGCHYAPQAAGILSL